MMLESLARTADRVEANTRAGARQQSKRRPPLRAWIADWLRGEAPVRRNPSPLLAPTKTPHTVPGPLPVPSTGAGREQANTRRPAPVPTCSVRRMAWRTGQVYGARSCAPVTWPCFIPQTQELLYSVPPQHRHPLRRTPGAGSPPPPACPTFPSGGPVDRYITPSCVQVHWLAWHSALLFPPSRPAGQCLRQSSPASSTPSACHCADRISWARAGLGTVV